MDRYTLASEIRRLLPEAIGPVRDHLQQAHDLCLRTAENGVTDKQLAALPKGAQLSDPSCQGLVARHTARSGIVWIVRVRSDGRDHLHRIGLWPGMSPKAARTAWREVKSGHVTIGTLQVSASRSASQRLSGPVLLKDVADAYLQGYPFTSTSNERQAKAQLNKLVELAGNPPIEGMTRSFVRDLLVKVERARGPQAATKTRNFLSKAWQYGQGVLKEKRLTSDEVLIDTDLANPAVGIRFTTSKEQFPLTPQELDDYWVRLTKVGGISDTMADLLMLQALTLSRIGEICGIRNEWVNLTDGYIEIPQTKNKGMHRLMLGTQARQIVDKHYDPKKAWLFRSPRGGAYNPKSANKAVADHLEKLGIQRSGQDLELKGQPNTHALRRSGTTWLTEQGIDQGVIDRAINHKPRGVTAKYNWSAHLWPQVLDALEQWDKRLWDAILRR